MVVGFKKTYELMVWMSKWSIEPFPDRLWSDAKCRMSRGGGRRILLRIEVAGTKDPFFRWVFLPESFPHLGDAQQKPRMTDVSLSCPGLMIGWLQGLRVEQKIGPIFADAKCQKVWRTRCALLIWRYIDISTRTEITFCIDASFTVDKWG